MLWQHFLSPPLSWMPCQALPSTHCTTHPGQHSGIQIFNLQFDSDEQPGWRIPLRALGFIFFILSQYLHTNETTEPYICKRQEDSPNIAKVNPSSQPLNL